MNTNQSMTGFIKESVKQLDSEKLIYFNRKLTTKQVFVDVSCVATFLKHNGVGKGDSVMICLPNIAQSVVALYAINSLGAIANIVHPKIGTDGLLKIAKQTKTKWIFIFDRFFVKHRKMLAKNQIKSIICRISDCLIGKPVRRFSEPIIMSKNAVSYNSALVKPSEFDVEINGEDIAVYLHSSGTTGDSKTVMLSNYAMNELANNIYECVQPKDGESMLMTLPVFHGFGLGVCVHLMMMFGKIILLPIFSAKKAVSIMGNKEVNYLAVVPNMLRKLIAEKGFSGKKVKYLRRIFVGGDKLNDNLRKKAQKIMEENNSSCRICEGFGMSETASVTHINCDCKDGGTVGKPLRGVKVKIIKDGKEAECGQDGVIYISSNSLMSGYLDAESPIEVDENGIEWLNTGDIGHLDSEDCLYYKGRQKRMLKVGGVNIFPQEVETIAETVSEVKNACAVRTLWNGKPALKLLVVTKSGEKISSWTKQKICDAISSGIMPYAVPKFIECVPELKMTGMAKTDYRYYEEQESKE